MFIDEITFLDQIFETEKKQKNLEGIDVTNISYWNPSSSYKQYMDQYIQLDCKQDIFDYLYTYDLTKDQRIKIMEKLGVKNPMDSMCLLNPTGTSTILNLINFLKLHKYRKLGILTPSYFSVEQSCKICGLPYENISLEYFQGNYCIPWQKILKCRFDAIWLTSPTYSTGVSFDELQLKMLKKIMSEKILIIADETLALPNQMLISKLPISDYFFSICSPHKPLFINKIKFSALICPKKNDDFLEQWVDILSGSLLSGNLIAIKHFLSDNFMECVHAAQHWYGDTLKNICKVLKQFPNLQYNLEEVSPYKTIYFTIPKDIKNLNNINTLISKDYVSYIPLEFNNYYGFRINMSLNPQDLSNALYRILKFYT